MKNKNENWWYNILVVISRINCFDTSGLEINRKLHCRFMNTASTDKTLFTKLTISFQKYRIAKKLRKIAVLEHNKVLRLLRFQEKTGNYKPIENSVASLRMKLKDLDCQYKSSGKKISCTNSFKPNQFRESQTSYSQVLPGTNCMNFDME